MAGYKEKLHAAIAEKARAAGVCDERGAAFFAASERGLVLLAVDGNELTISEGGMNNSVGRCLRRIPLKEVTSLTVKGFLSQMMGGEALSFLWQGKKFAFHNVVVTGPVKECVNVIRKEAGV